MIIIARYTAQLVDSRTFLPKHKIIQPFCAAHWETGTLPDTWTNLAINSMSEQKPWKGWTIQRAQAIAA